MTSSGKKRKLDERDDIANGTKETEADSSDEPAVEDEPAKSHAQLRKEKKRALKQVKDGADDSIAPSQANSTKKEYQGPPHPPLTRQNSVWVGNLAYKTTPDALRKFFDGVGEITRVHMPTKNAGPGAKMFNVHADNMGFAYVDFATPDAKTIAITLSETNLDGRKLLIKDGGDFTGRPSAPTQTSQDPDAKPSADGTAVPQKGQSKFAQKVLKNQKQPPAPTLFMGNLPFEIVIQDIRSMLEVHRSAKKIPKENADEETPKPSGPVKWLKKIRLGTFEDTGKCKGWAFLDFVDVTEATGALTNPRNHKMNGRDLVLEYASPDAVRRGGQLGSKETDRPRKKPRVDNPKRYHREDPEGNTEAPRNVEEDNPQRKERKGKDGKARPRPGAALAMARRENVAIVESEGQKIKF